MPRDRAHPPDRLALGPDSRDPAAAPPVADSAAREAALDPGRSFIVQAPAGSGKTGLLIQRCLVVLAQAREPEEVLALTFTRKAAAEMRSRVLDALAAARAGAAPGSPPAARTLQLAARVLARNGERGWDLEANPGRLQIMTIDALCSALTRRMPLLSGLGPVPRMETDARALYRAAARETLALLDDAEHGDAVATLLLHLDNDLPTAEGLLERLLQRRDQWLRSLRGGAISRESVERALVNLARERMARARAAAPAGLTADIVGMLRYAAGNLLASGAGSVALDACAQLQDFPGDAIDALAVWRAMADLLLTKDDEPRKQVNVRQGFPPAGPPKGEDYARRREAIDRALQVLEALAPHDRFVAALAAVRALPEPGYDERQWSFIQALGRLLPLALAQLRLVFQQHGAVDFAEATLGAIEALGEVEAPTDLALALDYRIQHLLIDEFQDTSYSHFELLQRLTAGWQPGDGRTLFLVGDPMQSIYRFREAEVGLFLRVRARGLGELVPEPLALQVNFRSQAAVVDWVNEVFARVLPATEDIGAGAVTYAPSTASKASTPGAGVEVHPLIDEQAATEPALVVDLIRRAQLEQPDGSIALLVRAKTQLAQIVPRLHAAGIGFRAIEIESLGERPVVRDLHALTRALVHPADRTAWLTLLRAPWCGMSLCDLEILAGNDPTVPPGEADAFERTILQLMHDEPRIARLSADGRARLERLRAALDPVLAERGRGSLRRRVESAWLRLGGPACAQDEVDLDDAQVLLRLIDELERGGDLEDLASLDERLGSLFALPDPHAPDRLQVMTIHKSKGLEFDTVIVAGLGRRPRGDDPQLLHWIERHGVDGAPDLLLAALTEKGRETDPIYACVSALHAERQREEDSRLMYVAVTRAKRRAHLIGHVALDARNGNARPPPSTSLLARLWPALAPQFDAAARAHAVPDAGSDAVPVPAAPPQRLRRLREDWRLPPPPPPVQWRAPTATAEEERAPEIEFSWAGETARHVGTVVHRFLQQIAEDGLARWSPAQVDAAAAIAGTALRAEGVPAAELQQACERVRRALHGVLDDQRARWVLDRSHPEAHAELRLTAALDGELVHVAVDRTFVAADGTRWIVDYKTSAHEGGDLESFLDREQQRYRLQLERYARVLRGLDGRPVRVALYFPLLGAWREWAPG